MKRFIILLALLAALVAGPQAQAQTTSEAFKDNIYRPGDLKPVDSVLKVKVGDPAPEFTLPAISGTKVSLAAFREKKNVVLSFVPAAWTPVCSDQWPGYAIVKPLFDQHDAVLLGISVDNVPTLHAWTNQMGKLWFEVLSDFWPHGEFSQKLGILRSDGTAERALFVIDKKGVIRAIEVSDINQRPKLEWIVTELKKLGTAN